MNARDAIQQSESKVIKAKVRDGLVAIAMSDAGYQLSFIPCTAEAEWNLAGTVARGMFSTLDQAAWASEATDWEPAPENIVGSEPAYSIAPEVEGHHIRHHLEHVAIESDSSSFLKHPLHRQLSVLPAALLPCGFVMDVLHFATGKQSYAEAGYHTMWGGVLGGLVTGAIDYTSIPADSPTKEIDQFHTGLNIAMIALSGASLLMRHQSADKRPSLLSTTISGAAATGLLMSAWFAARSAPLGDEEESSERRFES